MMVGSPQVKGGLIDDAELLIEPVDFDPFCAWGVLLMIGEGPSQRVDRTFTLSMSDFKVEVNAKRGAGVAHISNGVTLLDTK